jgi:hypothetical protein
MVAIATLRDHRLQGRARDLQIALLERAPRIMKALVVAALRLGDGGRAQPRPRRASGRWVDERDAAEDEGGLARVTASSNRQPSASSPWILSRSVAVTTCSLGT